MIYIGYRSLASFWNIYVKETPQVDFTGVSFILENVERCSVTNFIVQ